MLSITTPQKNLILVYQTFYYTEHPLVPQWSLYWGSAVAGNFPLGVMSIIMPSGIMWFQTGIWGRGGGDEQWISLSSSVRNPENERSGYYISSVLDFSLSSHPSHPPEEQEFGGPGISKGCEKDLGFLGFCKGCEKDALPH